MFLYLIVCIILIGLTIFNWRRFRDVCYPGFLQAFIWTVILIAFSFLGKLFDAVSLKLFLVLVLGLVAFSIGSIMSTLRHVPSRKVVDIHQGTLPRPIVLWTFLLIPASILPAYLARTLYLANQGPSDSILQNIRIFPAISDITTEMTVGGVRYGILSYVQPLSICLTVSFILLFATRKYKSKTAIVITLTLSAAFSVLTLGGRTSLFLLLLSTLGIPLIIRRLRPGIFFVVIIALGLIIFATIGILVGKGGSLKQPFNENISGLGEQFLKYSFGPVVALDKLLNSKYEFEMGRHTLRFFLVVLQHLGFRTSPPQLVREYVLIPFPINVYTIYDPYYRDFGLLGILVIQFLLGMWHGALYKRATKPRASATAVLIYVIFLYPLVFQFFQDQYASLLSMWVQYGLWIFLFTKFLRLRKPKKKKLVYILNAKAKNFD
ncbi:MAG: O-antigen polymerase [Candidatus Hodarchaeota archaeon]